MKIGKEFSQLQITEMMSIFDKNGDGEISIKEFLDGYKEVQLNKNSGADLFAQIEHIPSLNSRNRKFSIYKTVEN